MKFLVYFLITVFTFNTLHAQNLPKEWMMLFDCIHANKKKLDNTLFNDINNNLHTFNSALNHIDPERVSAFMKAILYRQLLESPPLTKKTKDTRSILFIEKFFSDYEKNHKTQSCKFTHWIIESLQADFGSIKKEGGFSNSNETSPKNLIEAKGTTIQQYVSNWVDFLQQSFDEKDTWLMNYYGNLVLTTGKILHSFSIFSPAQPTTITYLNWSFNNPFPEEAIDTKSFNIPSNEDKKSVNDMIEMNLPTTPAPDKSKSQAIDELIKKKKMQDEEL